MKSTMAKDWDAHYADPAYQDHEPAPLLVQVAEMLPPGRALDLACGAGRHALYLASLGWRVTAVDASRTGVEALRRKGAGMAIEGRVADLELGEFAIEPDGYDLICDFFYLQRNLLPSIRAGVRVGGVFAAAIHLKESAPGARPRNPLFQMESGELREAFAGWKILYYSESLEPGHSRRAARIIARRA
jgi:tellurite methyltransferase